MSTENIENVETVESKESLEETSKCETPKVITPTKKEISDARKLALAKARAARTLKAKQRRETLNKLLI